MATRPQEPSQNSAPAGGSRICARAQPRRQGRTVGYRRQTSGDLRSKDALAARPKRTDRPQLKAAMAHAKAVGATLVIAKLDRLALNLHFVSGLMEGGVDFVAADNPHANRLTIHILAAVAEDEARRI